MSDLLAYARDTVGVSMGSIHEGRRIGWTTDAHKARLLRDEGASVTTVRPRCTGGVTGWEISFALDAARLQREDAPNGRMV